MKTVVTTGLRPVLVLMTLALTLGAAQGTPSDHLVLGQGYPDAHLTPKGMPPRPDAEVGRQLAGRSGRSPEAPQRFGHKEDEPPDPYLFPLDTAVRYGAALGMQFDPAVAFDGENYMAAWLDYNWYPPVVAVARISPAGELLDTVEILLDYANPYGSTVGIAFNGCNYLVVWDANYAQIVGTRLTTEGVMLDSQLLMMSNAPGMRSQASVASDGENWLVVWSDGRDETRPTDIMGTRVDPDGRVLDPDCIVLSGDTLSDANPHVAFDGKGFLVTWDKTCDGITGQVFGAGVSREGMLDSSPFDISRSPGLNSGNVLAFGAGAYLVAWSSGPSTIDTSDLYGVRVTPDGVILDSPAFVISGAQGGQWSRSVGFDGTNYVLAWTDTRRAVITPEASDIYAARVSADGTVMDRAGILLAYDVGPYSRSALGFDGGNFCLVWDYFNGWGGDIMGTRLSPDGIVLDSTGFLVSSAAYPQYDPNIACDGTNYLVIWNDERRSGFDDVYGMRFDHDGRRLDPVPFLVEQTWFNSCGLPPVVTYGAGNYLAVWIGADAEYQVRAARISRGGVVLDTPSVLVASLGWSASMPGVASDGTNYLLAWGETGEGQDFNITGRRVSSSGLVLDTAAIRISTAEMDQSCPSIAFDGRNYLVVWTDGRNGMDCDVYGARVTPDGIVLDSAGIPIGTGAGYQFLPTIVFDGVNYLVSWSDDRSGTNCDIYCARVSPKGVVLDSANLLVSARGYDAYSPGMAFDGSATQVVWTEYVPGEGADVRGATINRNGVVVDAFAVADGFGPQSWGRVAAAACGQTMVSYEGLVEEISGRPVWQVRASGRIGLLGGTEEQRTGGESGPASYSGPTLVRDGLWLSPASCRLRQVPGLLDASGRKVADLAPGRNDVSRLAAGVYFVTVSEGPNAVRSSKVIIQH
jgi:hypothetical protein